MRRRRRNALRQTWAQKAFYSRINMKEKTSERSALIASICLLLYLLSRALVHLCCCRHVGNLRVAMKTLCRAVGRRRLSATVPHGLYALIGSPTQVRREEASPRLSVNQPDAHPTSLLGCYSWGIAMVGVGRQLMSAILLPIPRSCSG